MAVVERYLIKKLG